MGSVTGCSTSAISTTYTAIVARVQLDISQICTCVSQRSCYRWDTDRVLAYPCSPCSVHPLWIWIFHVYTRYLFHAGVVCVSRRLCSSLLVLVLRVELIIWLCCVFIYCSFFRRSVFVYYWLGCSWENGVVSTFSTSWIYPRLFTTFIITLFYRLVFVNIFLC